MEIYKATVSVNLKVSQTEIVKLRPLISRMSQKFFAENPKSRGPLMTDHYGTTTRKYLKK